MFYALCSIPSDPVGFGLSSTPATTKGLHMSNTFPQTERTGSGRPGKTPLCTDLEISIRPNTIDEALTFLESVGLDHAKLDVALHAAHSVVTLLTDPEDAVFAYWFYAVPDPLSSAIPILSATKRGETWAVGQFNPDTYTR